MRDWKAIAKANCPEIAATELDRIAAALEALEKAFRPLVKALPPDLEPSLEFDAAEREE